MAFLLDSVGFAGNITFLNRLRVHNKGRRVEGVPADLRIGESVFCFQPGPERRRSGIGDHDGLPLHVRQTLDVVARMRDQNLRVFLEYRHYGFYLHAFLQHVQGNKAVRTHPEICRTSGNQLRYIHAGSALGDGDLESRLFIKPFGKGFIETAVLGLSFPVCDE